MQRNVISCDVCNATDLPTGHAVLTATGDRAKPLIHGNAGRNQYDICDGCVTSYLEWVTARRGTPAVPLEPHSPHAPHVFSTSE